jgi:hypothetical protein
MSDKHGPDPDPDTGAVLGGTLSPQGAGARSCGVAEEIERIWPESQTNRSDPPPITADPPALSIINQPQSWSILLPVHPSNMPTIMDLLETEREGALAGGLAMNASKESPQVSEAEILATFHRLTGCSAIRGAEALLAIEAGWGQLRRQRDGAQLLAIGRGQELERAQAALRLLTRASEDLGAEAQRLREAVRRYLLAPLGRPVAEAWVALAMALDVLDGRTPPGSYVTDRAITTENDRWITYAVAAMSRLRRALDDRTQPTTVKILIWQHGPCAIEAWSNLGTERGWLRREARYGEGADPDRAIEAWEQAEWHTGLEVCGSHECQERARRLAWARRRLAELTAGHGQTCPDGHADTCDRCRVARELRDAAGCCPDEIDIYGRAAKAEELLRRLLDLHLPLVPAKKRRYQEDENGWSMLLHGTVLEADRLLLRDQPDLCELCEGLGVFIDGDGDECCCPNCEGGGVVI